MTGYNPENARQVVPRWRSFRDTLQLGELAPVPSVLRHRDVESDFLVSKLGAWNRHRTPAHAADLVGAALVLGRESEVRPAAKFLLRPESEATPWAEELAQRALGGPTPSSATTPKSSLPSKAVRAAVRTFRELLNLEPRDPITWVDLARAYSTLGHRKQSERSMKVALQLAPDNRFVLRSASRLWIHLDDPERAHALIARSAATRGDPWLLAAEIATAAAAGTTPRQIKWARRVLGESRFVALHLSELASALATLELAAGSSRKARKLFQKSLHDPTDNSLAQVVWASRHHSGVVPTREQLCLPRAFEARSADYYVRRDWQDCVEGSRLWLADQPFSSRPAIQGSYVTAVVLEDYAECEAFARRGLLPNPQRFGLLNNLAFAQINQGNLDSAEETLNRANRSAASEAEKAVLRATQGLLAFRRGRAELGRERYLDAISIARSLKQGRLLALASVFYALEERRQMSEHADTAVSQALRHLDTEEEPTMTVLRDRLSVTDRAEA